ncbi:MAG: hypothetical protein RQ736_08235 [Thiogranum sp.]|nr:hypothetical protein [Thiogranum sp.]
MAIPVKPISASEGVAAVFCFERLIQVFLADVNGINASMIHCHFAVRQTHGERIRLFAAGTGNTQDAQWGSRRESTLLFPDPVAECDERIVVTEKPGLGYDNCLDQRIKFGRGAIYEGKVFTGRLDMACPHANINRLMDGVRADCRTMQAHTFMQQSFNCIERHLTSFH